MFLGRIVTKGKIENVPFFIEVTDKEGDYDIPTLIVGKQRAIDCFGKENIHFLDKQISENVSWTFAKNERRVEFEEDTAKFIENISKSLNFKVKYYFFNIFTEKLSLLKKFIRYMYGKELKSVYITKNHIYIYSGKNVIGLSLADFEYAGISSNKVISKIKSNHNNIVITEEDLPQNALKTVKGNNIIIPYLHYLTL